MGFSVFRRRREAPWEVVDSRVVEPVLYYDDDDLELLSVGSKDVGRTYIFDLNNIRRGDELSKSLSFAQQQLLNELSQRGYNTLLSESWTLTVLRKGSRYRIEVRYSGRPAHVVGKLPATRPPPFINVLRELN